ncbi:COP9 signalosome complex subunit 8-like [Myxocyprinus asiaticus]|uniref:COP9 signalosome complex subunit 8-like n=1 Tax=Myxocyprinus asiaticus TaxID=70543 RepID=UPI0022237142|nr:COP9 signalosome complex subunit 8-like [Myxocyprinus asiaticus]
MPVSVMMAELDENLLLQFETQELEAPGGIATPQVYSQLLVLYLLHDMNNARYLWKRIPQAIKTANPELSAIWAVGQRIWQRDFPGIYTAIAAYQWSENILPVMEALQESTRSRAYGLVAQAYTSISADDFAAFVGYSVEEAVKGVVSHGWQADPNTRMIMPQKPDPPPVSLVPNEQQLARLTDYVAFLEN